MMDVLLYMSDQHSYNLQGYAGNNIVRTPNLDRIAREGTALTSAYTACPLCVPARASMISGQLPSNNGVLFNFNSIHSDSATFLHSLTVSGYETVLCGRMHFVGPDQRHGYAKRIAKERTPVYHNNAPKTKEEMENKSKVMGFDENSSLYYIGGGDSPVLAYDRYVVGEALDYLSKEHERPQFITVGTYGPHFPYVAPEELYEYYYDKVSLEDVSENYQGHPALDGKFTEGDPEVARAARAAYYGLVEQQDRHIGTVYDAFQKYLKRTGHEGIFIYVSDHGDMNGTHGYYGKQVFYEPSSHIPFLIQGNNIPAGRRIDSPTSLLDMGPTICGLTGAEILEGDGKDISAQIMESSQDEDRMVVSELYTYLSNGETSLGRLVRYQQWKYITYSGFPEDDVLYDLEQDLNEEHNVIARFPEIAEKLRQKADSYKSYDQVMEHENWVMKQLRILMKCDYDNPDERWIPSGLKELDNPVKSKKPFQPTPWAALMRKRLNER
ncbi:choline-sulfatase [Lacrimispora xylanisolvens]|uniref:Choline-sulfatase n=1 Tax=Lacrimispora xylanisolvens TaxID=384636 RepID=A0A2S6HBC2_9FIRM|nr:sulfatase-like hydrolase/transferase [Hungatella xylanolytica]PPK74721.1 choline-sulfatase [Hungatella xylanolytica]